MCSALNAAPMPSSGLRVSSVLSVACWMKGAFVTPLASPATRSLRSFSCSCSYRQWLVFYRREISASARISPTATTSGDWNASRPIGRSGTRSGPRVFIDFTAAWCITCKFNEATVLETSAVRDAFRIQQIVKLKADWTNADPAITKLLKQFGRPGVPFTCFIRGGKFADPLCFRNCSPKASF